MVHVDLLRSSECVCVCTCKTEGKCSEAKCAPYIQCTSDLLASMCVCPRVKNYSKHDTRKPLKLVTRASYARTRERMCIQTYIETNGSTRDVPRG